MTREEIIKKIYEIISKVKPNISISNNENIFSQKQSLQPYDMVYILTDISKAFHFEIDDDFVDSLENCNFLDFENLIVNKFFAK